VDSEATLNGGASIADMVAGEDKDERWVLIEDSRALPLLDDLR